MSEIPAYSKTILMSRHEFLRLALWIDFAVGERLVSTALLLERPPRFRPFPNPLERFPIRLQALLARHARTWAPWAGHPRLCRSRRRGWPGHGRRDPAMTPCRKCPG